MGNKASNQSRRTTHQQQWPSTQSAQGAGATGSNQQLPSLPLSVPLMPPAALSDHLLQRIHEPVSNQPPRSLSSDSSHPSQAARTVQSRRADDQVGQPHNWPQAGTEQRQLIPLWLSEPSSLLSSDPALPSLTARRVPRRRENDYVTLPLQRTPAIVEQRQTVLLQPLVLPVVPIARRSSFSRDSTEPFGEAAILGRQAVPSEASAPHCTAVDTVDALLDSSAVGVAVLSPPLLPQQAAAPPLLPSPFRKPPAQPAPHRREVRPLLRSGSCDGDSPVHVGQTDVSALSSPRPPQGTPAIGAAASTSYGLQRSPVVLNVPELMRKSPAAAPDKLSAAKTCAKTRHHRRPASKDAQRISPAFIAAPKPSTHDTSSIGTDVDRPYRESHGVHDDSAVQRRQDEFEDDELLAHVALRERRRPPPPPLSGAALESYVWAKLRPPKAPSAMGGQSQRSIAPGFGGDGEACIAVSSRNSTGSRRAASAGSSGDPAAAPGELSADGEGARAGRRWPASKGVRNDLPASSLAPSTSTCHASTTGADRRRPHREPRDTHDGRAERRRHVKVMDEELLARVAMRQRRWLPPPQLSSETLESYLWAKLRPAKSRSAKSGQSPPVPLLSALGFDSLRDAHTAASSGFSPRAGSRKAAFTEFGGLAEGYYADTEEEDERRRERSRFEQECYDAELSQRFAAAAAPRASFGLFSDSGPPISSSAGASWASAKAAQKSTTSELVTTSASGRSAPSQVCVSLVVHSASTSGTTAGSSVVGLPLCGRLQPQAQVYSSQPMVPK